MKKFIKIAFVATLFAVVTSSCVKDLNVKPIDPNTVLPEDVLNSEEAFNQLLAKCYQGLGSSASAGPDSSPDIDGVDGGYGQYMRAVVNLEEITTDIATVCWNDGNLFDLHNMCWNPNNEFVFSMYMRIFFQVSQCNEFIRRAKASEVNPFPKKDSFIAEARALRLLSYYHAIDMFGNVPFCTEENSVGSTAPERIERADLFDWMVNECNNLLGGNDLAAIGANEYGRADKGLVKMILAKLYLNAAVWKGQDKYDECAKLCDEIIADYPLHKTDIKDGNSYAELFCADNHNWTYNTTYPKKDELIFVAPQDGLLLRSYGSTNFLTFACTFSVEGNPDKTMDAGALGISSGWSGISMTGTFTSKFGEIKENMKDNADRRAMFFTGGYNQYIDQIRDASGGSEGYKSMKFANVNHDGSAAQANGFVDIDFPIFRSADAYLMYAECAARGKADKAKGLQYLNAVRARAGVGELELTLPNIIDERARELYLEGHRRQDLIRFGMFTGSDYLWEFKGGVQEGKAVDSHFNLFSIPADDINANGNLVQNPGY